MRRSVSAMTRFRWIASLSEDTRYDAVERHVVVVAVQRMLEEVAGSLGTLLAPKMHIERTVAGSEDCAPDCIWLKGINR